ncbi:MAG: HEXXH motif-containing putative peptide modification protein [Lautropia sp.]
MTVHLGFAPDAVRARAVDRRMYTDLAASLRHVTGACGGRLPYDREAMTDVIASLEGGTRCTPETFASYYDLVSVLIDGDDAAAVRIFNDLTSKQHGLAADRVLAPLQPLDACARSARYHRMMVGDSDSLGMQPVAAEIAAGFSDRFDRGMALMRSAVPDLAGEVDAIVHVVVPVASDRSKNMQIDGGSHFQLWGALFLNADFHPDDVAMLEVIAHESAHSLLFGLCHDEMLVENDDDEHYASPLRTDLRPMDGIYHATFVSARMHWAMSRLLESGAADAHRAAIATAREADRRNFEAGESVVARHGQLTRLGREVMDGARRYMATV